MPTAKITKRVVDALTPGDRDMFLWDDGLKGFGLKCTPRGRKVFLIQYRTVARGASSKRYTIGPYGSPWTPALEALSKLSRLGNLMPKGEAKTMINAALRPDDMLTRQMAEFVWDNLPPEKKSALGNTVEDLLEDIRLGKPLGANTTKLISPAAQRMMRQKSERTWD
jgi:hypothetical protein